MKKSKFLEKYSDKPAVNVDIATGNITIVNNFDRLKEEIKNRGFSLCYDTNRERFVKIAYVKNKLKEVKSDMICSLPFYNHEIDYLFGSSMIIIALLMFSISWEESLEYLVIIIPIFIKGVISIIYATKIMPFDIELRKVRMAIHKASNTKHRYQEVSVYDSATARERILQNEDYLNDKRIQIFSDDWQNSKL